MKPKKYPLFRESAVASLAGNNIRWEPEELWRMLGHDMRTPLNGIQGFLDLLSGTRLDPEQRDYLETALECTESLRSILDGVLECARIDSGKLLVSTQATNIRELIESVVQQHKLQASRQQTELKAEISPAIPRLLSLDKAKLRQILANLIDNAVKFSQGGTVTVRARRSLLEKESLLLEIVDTGIGIPEDQISKVSEAFYQCARNDGYTTQGSGLGLAIVKKLVAVLGGELSIESPQGNGTIVAVSLPYKN